MDAQKSVRCDLMELEVGLIYFHVYWEEPNDGSRSTETKRLDPVAHFVNVAKGV